jgi:hypothetical protein
MIRMSGVSNYGDRFQPETMGILAKASAKEVDGPNGLRGFLTGPETGGSLRAMYIRIRNK